MKLLSLLLVILYSCSNAVQQRHHFDESDAVIAKLDVRPKPKESKNDNWLEASGYPSWEDDEDLGGEVSGSGKEPSDDAAVEFVQEFTTTPKPIGITPATTRTTPHPKFAKGEAAAKPNFEVVEKVPEEPEEKKTVPDSTGCLSLWIVAVLSGAHLLRWW